MLHLPGVLDLPRMIIPFSFLFFLGLLQLIDSKR